MSKTFGIVTFVAGAVIGSAVTWYCTKNKYEQLAQEEIDSVKEVFSNRQNDIPKEEETEAESEDEPEEEQDISEYVKMTNDYDYTNHYESDKKMEKKPMGVEKPYVISPDEFGDFDDYETISLSYYSDQILADDADHIIEDVEGIVGFESLGHFGEYEDDSVFVRNDQLKCDYEILLIDQKYSDLIKEKPYLMEV